jgi:membrane-bound serine protease (ClpP class)
MRRIRQHPLGSLGLVLILSALLLIACTSSTRAPDQVHVLTWKGDVNPVMEQYVDRGLDTAEKSQARAVVLRLDTPGGLDSAMRKVIQRIDSARVPVIVYVAPAGGRAASAGTFITMAGHVAAMAPNTTIGAATPIDASGEDIPGALGRKVTNDAIAYIRGIAELRGRNADWAESAVRDAAAVSADRAVELDVVDFVGTSIDDVLTKADGREVEVMGAGGAPVNVVLRTAGAPTTNNGTNFFERVLYYIADPNVAFLLLSLGGLALLIELLTPGFGVGIFGVIALVLAYFSLGALPVDWAGVALILLGIALLAAEVYVGGFGALGIGGIAALIFGGLILSGDSNSGYQVSRLLILVVAIAFGGFALLLAGSLVALRRMGSKPAAQVLGSEGIARTELAPDGVVLVMGERWNATAEDGPIHEDEHVLVTRVDGLKLRVRRDPAYLKALPAASTSQEGL